eukprot:gnl/MRDRNA2_/MRDRNA2_136737_c0_seq1.p1 gnl/MRDRNA2_/MRDRNA2_136737_c0~~gnl/MRDRNA2_/MRDRNA2_136737_c0_seq1.p1  ORF type:complete len:504 (-),score=113.37 gnl/MRDRNA2_/MRDRNA2_136737_c0_seq1:189-1700(-)
MPIQELSQKEDDLDELELDSLLQEIADLQSTSPNGKVAPSMTTTLNAESASWKPFGLGGMQGSSPMYIDFSSLTTKVDEDLVSQNFAGPWRVPINGGAIIPPQAPPGLRGFGLDSSYEYESCLVHRPDLLVGADLSSTEAANSATSEEDPNDSNRTGSCSTAPMEAEHHDSGSDENERSLAEDPDLFRTLRLRGLPYRAREEDVRRFLGRHLKNVAQDGQAVRFITNSDGRPSGFATVRFVSHAAAKEALEDLHNKRLDHRYIEVFGLRERHSRQRHAENGSGSSLGSRARDATLEPQREQAVRECVAFMSVPERNQVLLSMLGVALSDASRAFLKRHALGLKSFLAELEDLFRIEGPKGAERVIFVGNENSLNSPPLTGNESSLTSSPMTGSMGTPVPPPGLASDWAATSPSMRLELFPLVGDSLRSDQLALESTNLDPSAAEYQPWDSTAESPTIPDEAAQTPQWPWNPSGFPVQADDMSTAYDGYNNQWSLGSPTVVGCF